MNKLSTIQKHENLNTVLREGEPGAGGAYHDYRITGIRGAYTTGIHFQKGARKGSSSRDGLLDTDLLEIVRDRLRSFQAGEFATEENAHALTHVEEALLWMNKRVEERIERDVLGTYEK